MTNSGARIGEAETSLSTATDLGATLLNQECANRPANVDDTLVSVFRAPGAGRVRRYDRLILPLPRQNAFGKGKNPCRLAYGIASIPLGTPVELESIFEVSC